VKAPRREEYAPPPEHACAVGEGPIDLLYDADTGERHVLYRKVHWYKGLAVWFSLQQTIYDADGRNHVVTRVDCCDSEVHRHVFRRDQGEIERISLVRIPPLGQTVVDREFDRYLDEMLSNWEARVRTWRQP
jgi:hypothetical protein